MVVLSDLKQGCNFMQSDRESSSNSSQKTPNHMKLDDIMKNIKRTKHNRFQAARRLSGEHNDITIIISLCSMAVITLSLVPEYFQIEDQYVKSWFGFISVIFSIFIIALTLIQDSRKRTVNAELLHRCGVEILKILDEAKIMRKRYELTEEQVAELAEKYHEALDKYNVTHEDADYLIYKSQWPGEFVDGRFKMCLYKNWCLARAVLFIHRYKLLFAVVAFVAVSVVCIVWIQSVS